MKLDFDCTSVFEKNYEAFNQEGISYIVNEGGSRCFAGDTLVQTLSGDKRINEIIPGDMVKTMDEVTKEIVWKPVMDIFHSPNNTKPSVRIKMKNGDIIECTLDHMFYFEGGFTSIKNILSLKKK